MKNALVAKGLQGPKGARRQLKQLVDDLETGDKKKKMLQEQFLKQAKKLVKNEAEAKAEIKEEDTAKIKALEEKVAKQRAMIADLKKDKLDLNTNIQDKSKEIKDYEDKLDKNSKYVAELEEKLKLAEEAIIKSEEDKRVIEEKLGAANNKVTLQASKIYVLLRDNKNKLKATDNVDSSKEVTN